MFMPCLDHLGKGKNISAPEAEHRNHKVDITLLQDSESIFGIISLNESRRISQVKGDIFIEYLFIDPAVLLQHIIIIVTADYQHTMNPFLHQQIERGIGEIIFLQIEYSFYDCHASTFL